MTPVNIFQTAWIVSDLDRAIDTWINQFGAGPFYKVDDFRMTGFRYGDVDAPEHLAAAVGQSGLMQIELIAPKTLASPLFEIPAGAPSGLHHFGCIYPDFEQALNDFTKRGIAILGEGHAGNLRYAFADTRATLGALTEVIDGGDAGLVKRLTSIADAARDWDGTDPVRSWVPAQ